jgi:hypothetical protein
MAGKATALSHFYAAGIIRRFVGHCFSAHPRTVSEQGTAACGCRIFFLKEELPREVCESESGTILTGWPMAVR